jgi:hypothetical protein
LTVEALKYLKFTSYPLGAHFELVVYSNLDYASCKVDGKALLVVVNFLEGHLIFGLQRNKIQMLSQPPKRNIF